MPMPINYENVIGKLDTVFRMRRTIGTSAGGGVRLTLMLLKRPIPQPTVRDHHAFSFECAANSHHEGDAI